MEWQERISRVDHPHGFHTSAILVPSPDEPPIPVEEIIEVEVIDLFKSWGTVALHIPDAKSRGWVIPLLSLGLVPSAPIKPRVVFTARTIEYYRSARVQCPRFAIQSCVKSIFDHHHLAYHRYHSTLFSIAYDVSISIRNRITLDVMFVLGRDSPDYRLKHTCPSCMYRIAGEPLLPVADILFTMDGNDSLKRVARTDGKSVAETHTLAPSTELLDTREVNSDYYLPRSEVDKWDGAEADGEGNAMEPPSVCESRWQNMKPDSSKLTWGIFDETGLFLSLCRHGFVLLLVDMVRSGELSKYPLATIEKLVTTLLCRLGGGYDIGCKLEKTLERSIMAEMLKEQGYRSLVGIFHGYGHGRICQLLFLVIYILGLGLEDFETCERWFSKSNHLAAALRYASVFHRKQAIVSYAEHQDDMEAFGNLSKFLLDNYKQALSILDSSPSFLRQCMDELGIEDEAVIETWPELERVYLSGLKKEPEEETMQIEYHRSLEKLETTKEALHAIEGKWRLLTAQDFVEPIRDDTQVVETTRRHIREKYDEALSVVHSLESQLGIRDRWLPGSELRLAAAKKLAMRQYQRALDTVEHLVVSRIFELTKMNQPGLNYHLRKHIAKALKARSTSLHHAIDRYNEAALKLSPPRDTLRFEQVIEYAFLADFDLLRDTREDIRGHPWATPSGRLAMDTFFKIQRAKEEIQRLNVEIPRLATYLRDEDHTLRDFEREVRKLDPPLAHQIQLYRKRRGRFNNRHNTILKKIAALPGFSGSIAPGRSIGPFGEDEDQPMDVDEDEQALPYPNSAATVTGGVDYLDLLEAEDEGMAEDLEEELLTAFYRVLSIRDD